MQYIFLDIETKSLANLKTVGTANYAAHKSTEIISLVYRLSTWPAGKTKHWLPNQALPADLKNFKGLIVVHNWAFEFHIISELLVKKKLLPPFWSSPKNYTCTMSTAWRCGLKGALDDLCVNLKLKNAKLSGLGKELVQKYSTPKKNGEFNPITKEVLEKFIEYNRSDVLATEELFNTLPKLHEDEFEWPLFNHAKLKQSRGFLVDRENVEKTIKIYEKFVEQADKRARALCGETKSEGLIVTSSKEFPNWLNAELRKKKLTNYLVSNAQAFTLSELAKKEDLPDNVVEALKLRRALSRAAVKKLYPFIELINNKDIATHQTLYHKAHTGREAGFGIQPQNFPRVKADFQDSLKELTSPKLDISKTPEIITGMLRGFIIPRKGKSFLIGDLAAIEARLVFWFSQEQIALKAYRENKDIYKIFAGYIFDTGYEQITKDQRGLGKTGVLQLGYGSGPVKFAGMCEQQGQKISDELAQRIVRIYRGQYKNVVRMWYTFERAFVDAINGKPTKTNFVEFGKTNSTVWIKLPSGRKIYYFKPRVVNGRIQYFSNEGIVEIWGGVITNNIIQATARDLLTTMSLEAESKGIQVVLNVHDEIVGEVDKKTAPKKKKILEEIMSKTPVWLPDLPLGAEIECVERYCKI